MSVSLATVAERAELRRRIGILAEAGLNEAAAALGIPRRRYAHVQRLAGAWHALEAGRMRRAEAAWRTGRKTRAAA